MPGVVRLGDISRGHGCWGARPNTSASSDTFANTKGVHRVDDSWATHCCVSCHGGVAVQGSPNVFANGRAVVRQGDAISCGDHAEECSPDVIIN
jgi:uncharacterized Zn-binding protein involved in type VI secretion